MKKNYFRTKAVIVINIVVLTGITLLLYGYVLQLPFFYDDIPIMSWLATHQWSDIIQNPEGGYFRPLTLGIYKLGAILPLAIQKMTLHAANLLWLVLGAVLIQAVCFLCTRNQLQAWSAAILYITLPFFATTIPWITAMSHPLVVVTTTLAAYTALKAGTSEKYGWLYLACGAIFISTFIHESGAVAGLLVGGLLLSQHLNKKWLLLTALMISLSLGSVLLRPTNLNTSFYETIIQSNPGAELYAKGMFFSQSLLYPIMPVISWLMQKYGWNDFILITIADGLLALVLLRLIYQDKRNRYWILPALLWWGVGAIPATMAFNFAALYVAPRLYVLGAVGCVILWSGVIVQLPAIALSGWRKNIMIIILFIWTLLPGTTYIYQQRNLFILMADLYQNVLRIIADDQNHPIGFVNLPYQLTWNHTLYPLIHDGIVFVPWYANLSEFAKVNTQENAEHFETVIYGPVMRETDPFLGVEGEWLNAEQIYAYIKKYHTIQLTQLNSDSSKLWLHEVGAIAPRPISNTTTPLVQYIDGANIISATIQKIMPNKLKLTILWESLGPVRAEIFVHVYTANGNLITQADGPALSGLVPLWVWQPHDYIRDVRYITMPADTIMHPYRIGVGIYNEDGRFPAMVKGQRATDDVAIVATIKHKK